MTAHSPGIIPHVAKAPCHMTIAPLLIFQGSFLSKTLCRRLCTQPGACATMRAGIKLQTPQDAIFLWFIRRLRQSRDLLAFTCFIPLLHAAISNEPVELELYRQVKLVNTCTALVNYLRTEYLSATTLSMLLQTTTVYFRVYIDVETEAAHADRC